MITIALAGQARNGKDSIADHLYERLSNSGLLCERTAFAAAVKKVYCDTFGVDLDFVEKWKVIPEPPPGFEMSCRQSLQFIGDGFRKIKSSIWLDIVFRNNYVVKIISDCRYRNEFLRVRKERGINVLVGRPGMLNNDPNASESQIRPYVDWALAKYKNKFNLVRDVEESPPDMECFDVFIRNDGTKEELLKVVDDYLVPFVKDRIVKCAEHEECISRGKKWTLEDKIMS